MKQFSSNLAELGSCDLFTTLWTAAFSCARLSNTLLEALHVHAFTVSLIVMISIIFDRAFTSYTKFYCFSAAIRNSLPEITCALQTCRTFYSSLLLLYSPVVLRMSKSVAAFNHLRLTVSKASDVGPL
jgi:hypothetical protein